MTAEPGTRTVGEYDTARTVDGLEFTIREIHWNGTGDRSYDVYLDGSRLETADTCSFDESPSDDEIRDVAVREFICHKLADPNVACSSEYRAIHEVIVDALDGDDPPKQDREAIRNHVTGIIEQFEEWCAAIRGSLGLPPR